MKKHFSLTYRILRSTSQGRKWFLLVWRKNRIGQTSLLIWSKQAAKHLWSFKNELRRVRPLLGFKLLLVNPLELVNPTPLYHVWMIFGLNQFTTGPLSSPLCNYFCHADVCPRMRIFQTGPCCPQICAEMWCHILVGFHDWQNWIPGFINRAGL